MNVAMRRPMVLDEFLAWEREQELRFEFDGLQPVPLTGGSVAHSVVATNLVRALQDRLAGSPCRAFRGDLKIVVAGRVRYPDAVVTCSPVANDADVVPEPNLREAAALEGSGRWNTLRRVTLPLLMPTTLFVLVNAVINAFRYRPYRGDDAGRAEQRDDAAAVLRV